MKQIVSVSLFLLLAVICVTDVSLAQSGRRTGQSTVGAATTAPTSKSSSGSTSNPVNDGDVVDQGIVAQGETVEGDVVRVNTSLVTVPVSVMDRDGKYIPTLGREDFHIFEDGVEQRIAYFA